MVIDIDLLKSYFENGDMPNQDQFGDLIDTLQTDVFYRLLDVSYVNSQHVSEAINNGYTFVLGMKEMYLFRYGYESFIFNITEPGTYGQNGTPVEASQCVSIGASTGIINDLILSDLFTFSSNHIDLLLADTVSYIDSNFFPKTDFINSSGGSSDANKPVKLNSLGQIDPSMISVTTFYYVGPFTPSSSQEYPSTTGETPGAFWVTQGLSGTYTFTGGDLAGSDIENGDFMIWGNIGWSIMRGEMSPSLYYKLDGTQPLTADFAGGNHRLTHILDGIQLTDGATLGQVSSLINDLRNESEAGDQSLQTDIDAHIADKNNPHDIEWGDIGGLLGNQTDLTHVLLDKSDVGHTHVEADVTNLDKYTRVEVDGFINTKEDVLGNPDVDGKILSSLADGTRSWITPPDTITNWGSIQGTLSSQTDLQSALDGKADINHNHDKEYYLKTLFIDTSTGSSDAGKPVVLNSNGQLDASLLDVSTFHYVGPFTPTAGSEYPDTTGETPGAFWVMQNLTADYEFTTGDLTGKTVSNGDFMVWAAAGWSIMVGEMNPMLYYKLDGTQAITAPFAGGDKQFKNAADGTDPKDLITKGQLDIQTHTESQIVDLNKYSQSEVDGLLTGKLDVDGIAVNSNLLGGLDKGAFARLVHTHTESEITNLDKYTQAQVDAFLLDKSNTDHLHTSFDITDFTDAVTANPNVSDNTAARHGHGNISILNNIVDSGDGHGFLSNDGTYQNVLKTTGGSLDGFIDFTSGGITGTYAFGSPFISVRNIGIDNSIMFDSFVIDFRTENQSGASLGMAQLGVTNSPNIVTPGHAAGNLILKSSASIGGKNAVWLVGVAQDTGASQISSRLQIGFDQSVPDLTNPDTLVVNGNVGAHDPVEGRHLATKSYVDTILQKGSIVLFDLNTSTLPSGWKKCDGTNNTPVMTTGTVGVIYIMKIN